MATKIPAFFKTVFKQRVISYRFWWFDMISKPAQNAVLSYIELFWNLYSPLISAIADAGSFR